MTILDDLFNGAEGLWNSIQGTADQNQEVVVYAAPVSVERSDFDYLPEGPTYEALLRDRLIYSAASAALKSPATFTGSILTITAPNFHTIPLQPNYAVQMQRLAFTPTAFAPTADDVTGVFYFDADFRFVVVSLYALRLEAASRQGSP
jgi:hypothetical protein